MLAAPTLASIPNQNLLLGAPSQLPLDGFDLDGDALTYQVSSTNPNIVPVLHPGNRSVRIHVVHQGNGTTADPFFEGDLVFELFEDLAPRTTGHFLQLALQNPSFFNNIIFHRVIDDFMVQGGDPTGTGTGGSNLGDFDDEFHPDLQHTSRGLLSMAKSNDDTNDSQFFITLVPTRHLDFNHSIFGRLIEGDAVLEQMSNVLVQPNDPTKPENPQTNPRTRPVSPITMTSVTVFQDTQNEVLTLKTAAGASAGQTATITVTVNDGHGGTAQRTFTVTTQADTSDAQPVLQPIPTITTSANTQVQIQIPWTDADGGAAPIFAIGNSNNANLELSINPTTGMLTVTPKNGLTGVHSVLVGVQNSTSDYDIQEVPIYISPAAPTLDLLPVSDTGASDSDNVTRLNNSDNSTRLQFQVGNVVPGATVKIFAGATLIGQATAPTTGGTSLTITTNGTAALANGLNNITATQSLPEVDVDIANFHEDNVVLTSAASEPLPITIDRTAPSITVPTIPIAAPGQPLTINIGSNEEGNDGFQYALIQRPEGATINPATGVITWTPNVSQAGLHQFTVGTTDKAGNTSQQGFEVRVNSAPQLQPIQNQAVDFGVELTFLVSTLDPDLPSDTLTYSLTSAPAGATITAAENSQGRFRWTPSAGQSGLHTVTVRVTDAAGQFSEQTFQITVDDPEPPVLDAIPDQTADELAPYTFDVNATDGNLPNDTLVFSLVGTVPNGMTINAQTGVISWTPAEANGPQNHNITVRVTDAFQLTDEETFVLQVREVNTAPVIPPIADKSVNAGSELRFTIVATDDDLPAQDLSFSIVSGPALAVIDPETGEFVWTPSPTSQATVETITVRVQDALGAFVDQSFNVRVNVAPQIDPITDKTADEGQTLTVPVTATDPNGVDDTLTFSLVSPPAGASIDPATGVITFIPTETQGGQTLSITVRVTDEGGLSAETSFDVTVNEVNADPVIPAIADQRVNLGATFTLDVNATDSDLPQQTLVYSLDAGAPAGASIDPATGVITWTPEASQGIGPHAFTVRVSDGVATVSRSFNVTVNLAPTLGAVDDQTVSEGIQLSLTIVASDPNSPNETLTFSIQSGPAGATINPQTGAFTWTPSESQGPQSHSITVRVTDSGGLFADRTFNVQVNEVNAPPVIGAIGTRNVNEGATLSFNIPATDPDLPANTLTYSVVGQIPDGAALDPNTGAFTWTPTEAQGPQTFSVTVRVQDSAGASDEETFQIVVAEVNTAPQIDDVADQAVDEGSELTFTASATDSDTPANTIRFSLGAGAPAGATIDPVTGGFRWTPSESQGPGTFTITIVATDDGGLSDSTSVEVTVREVNTAPSINPISRQTVLQGATLRVNVDALDVDLPANALTFSLADAPEGATIDPQTGEISWRVPAQQTVGVLSFTVQVSDGAGATAELTFEVEVQRFDVTALIGAELDNLVNELQRNNFFEGVGGFGTLDGFVAGRGIELDRLAPITNGNPIAASTDRLQASNDIALEENAEDEGGGGSKRRETRRPTANESDVPTGVPETPPLRFGNPFDDAGTSAPANDEASAAPATNDLGDKRAVEDDSLYTNWSANSADAQGYLLAGLAHLASGVYLAGVADSAFVIELRHEPTAQEYFEARGEQFVLPKPESNSSQPAGSAVVIAVAAVAVSGPAVVSELAGQRAFYPPPPLSRRRQRRTN